MPRFYFDSRDGESLVCDEDGLDLPDLAAACEEASRALGEIIKDILPDGDERVIAIAARDEDGRLLFTATITFKLEMAEAPLPSGIRRASKPG